MEVNDLTDGQFEEICKETTTYKPESGLLDEIAEIPASSSALTKESVKELGEKLAEKKLPGKMFVLDAPAPPISAFNPRIEGGHRSENIILDEMTEFSEEDIAEFNKPTLIESFEPQKVEFIDKETYNELRGDWATIWPGRDAKVYQEYHRVAPRCKFLIKHGLPYLSGKRVLEIGANAGLQGYHIDQVAASYVGVEPGNKISKNPKPKTDYFLQAKKTEERMSDNGQFLNYTIDEFIENRNNHKFNAFFASFALYHFTDPELNKLKEFIFPECDVVIIQTRHQKRPTKHNKWKFWKPSQVERYFTRLGFNCHTINEVEVGEFQNKRPKPHNGFSLQICKRPESQK